MAIARLGTIWATAVAAHSKAQQESARSSRTPLSAEEVFRSFIRIGIRRWSENVSFSANNRSIRILIKVVATHTPEEVIVAVSLFLREMCWDKLSQVEAVMYFSGTAISRTFYRFFHSK